MREAVDAMDDMTFELYMRYHFATCEREDLSGISSHALDIFLNEDNEQVIQNDIAYYNALPCVFDGFIELPELSDEQIHLSCTSKNPAIPEKKWVPSYEFTICKGNVRIGDISLRIGYTDGLFYGGQVGYNIDKEYRGNGYAVRACQLLPPVAKAHGMKKLLITNRHTNIASRRVCEKLGARFIRVVCTPEWSDLYTEGRRFSCIFEWDIGVGV